MPIETRHTPASLPAHSRGLPRESGPGPIDPRRQTGVEAWQWHACSYFEHRTGHRCVLRPEAVTPLIGRRVTMLRR